MFPAFADDLRRRFEARFGQRPRLLRAPGRFNLIGEHTDYNEGWVMPAAIEQSLYLAFAPAPGPCEILAADRDDYWLADLVEADPPPAASWQAYVWAVGAELRERGHQVPALCMAFGGDIPSGAGLSSSAALCCALATAWLLAEGKPLDRAAVAHIAQAAEHRIGLRCGIMDQTAVMFGRAGHLLQLDCRSLAIRYLPAHFPAAALYLLDSGVKHQLAAGEGYNARRAACERVSALAREQNAALRSLRDLDAAGLEALRPRLAEADYHSARYVLAENARVHAVAAALAEGDMAGLGSLLWATHEGLRDDYRVSVAAIDWLVAEGRRLPGILGGRMVGGGFGGCVLFLVADAGGPAALARLQAAYEAHWGLPTRLIAVRPSEGLHELP